MKYFKEAEDELIYWASRVYQSGMAPATSGNISQKTQNGIIISASGTCLGDLDNDDLVEIDFDGNTIKAQQGKKPSSEKYMHAGIYEKREDIKAIIHAHCPFITAFAVCDKDMDVPILPEFIYNFDKIPVALYALPSSIKLSQNVAELFESSNVVLMQNHGVVAGASSVQEAFYALESVQAYAKTYIYSQILGKPCKLSKKDVYEIKNLKL